MTILPNKMSRELWNSIKVGDILVQMRTTGGDLRGNYYLFKVVTVDTYWKNIDGKQWETVFELTNNRGETLRYNDPILSEIHLINTGEK